jgi:hypothetical protein
LGEVAEKFIFALCCLGISLDRPVWLSTSMNPVRCVLWLLATVLLVGCASNPPPKSPAPANSKSKMDADNIKGLVGMLLMASAAQETNSPARGFLEVKISPTAFQVINSIAEHRRKFAKWPTQTDIALPVGVTAVGVSETEAGLDVTIQREGANLFRCGIEADGTVLVAPSVLYDGSATNLFRRIR